MSNPIESTQPNDGFGETTLFDSLARLVPDDLQANYYRVLAHTRELSPNDEMLRILEAMGILALITRHTPKDVADERERLQSIFTDHVKLSTDVEKKILSYVSLLDDRIAQLPKEVEACLNPRQISDLLGETLRQHFVQSGIKETANGLRATTGAMSAIQAKLAKELSAVSDPHWGILAQVERANRDFSRSLQSRTDILDRLMGKFRNDLLRIWIPLIAAASMAIGLYIGLQVHLN